MNRSFATSLALVEAQFPAERIGFRMRRAGINSASDLIHAAECSDSNAAQFYIWLLGRCEGRRPEASLLSVLAGPRSSLWIPAAASLSIVGTAHVVPTLTGMVLHDREPVRREASAYALGCINPGARARAVIKTLVRVLENPDVPRVRAQTAESLTQLLQFRRGRLRRAAETALIEHLSDDEPDVRFWCAYAVGELRTKAAIPALRRLARDRSVVPGWWSVGMEAGDALKVIAGGTWPERIGRAVEHAAAPDGRVIPGGRG
jgi:HEAT repeat protein